MVEVFGGRCGVDAFGSWLIDLLLGEERGAWEMWCGLVGGVGRQGGKEGAVGSGQWAVGEKGWKVVF